MSKIIIILSLIFLNACSEPVLMFYSDETLFDANMSSSLDFTGVVQEKIKQENINWRVVNEQVSSSKEALEKIEILLEKHKPEVIFLCLGPKDYVSNNNTSSLANNLEQIINILKNKNIRIVLAGIKIASAEQFVENLDFEYTLNNWIKKTNAFFKIHPKIAEKYDLIYYKNILDSIPEKNLLNATQAAGWQAAKNIGFVDILRALAVASLTGSVYASLKNLSEKIDFKNIGLREFFEEKYFINKSNLSSTGHRVVGEKLFDFLKPILFI